ncbi:MAG: hypothetical protein KKA05_02605 [Alphaproteobacteria bacterium]|nr:hypothetical protein [Alphaproteobacteria bacterium]
MLVYRKTILAALVTLVLTACGDPITVGMELPGGFVVKERTTMPSLEVCKEHAVKAGKGSAAKMDQVDERTTIFTSTLNTGQGLLQMCNYLGGEIFYTMAISKDAFP